MSIEDEDIATEATAPPPEPPPEPKKGKRGNKPSPEAAAPLRGLWKPANAVFMRIEEIDAAALAGRDVDATNFVYVAEERDGVAGFTMTMEGK